MSLDETPAERRKRINGGCYVTPSEAAAEAAAYAKLPADRYRPRGHDGHWTHTHLAGPRKIPPAAPVPPDYSI
jgi:hypothetical protein